MYPVSPADGPTETQHGVPVADPHRSLEDPRSESSRVWISAQKKLTDSFLETIPERSAIAGRLRSLLDFERYGVPIIRGGRSFFEINDGLENQDVLHVMDDSRSAPRILLDPNKLSANGTIALAGYWPTHDGKLLAYGLSTAGSDWVEVRVRDVVTGRDLPDKIEWVKFSQVSWETSDSGFYYSRYEQPDAGAEHHGQNFYHKLYHHRMGTPQAADRLIYERPDHKEWGFDGEVTESGEWLVITAWVGAIRKNSVFVKSLKATDAEVAELLPDLDAGYELVGSERDTFYFVTNKDAPRGKLVAVDAARPNRTRVVVPESDATLERASLIGGRFIASYLRDARSEIKVFGPDGSLVRSIDLPGLGTATGFEGDNRDTETYFGFTTFTHPTTIYKYDVVSGRSELFRRPQLPIDAERFETKQVFYPTRDGTKIPMFLISKQGLKPTGDIPTVLYGYGGFNISLTPAFSSEWLVWLELGGMLAVANLRGGGEYGEAWHEAGMRLRKQNVFDDFAAAAVWLVDQGYTKPTRLAINGRSNGGLLVGATLVQRPELFGAALANVGVLDMLRFHKFTIGWAWVPEYGSPEDPDDFKNLLRYSPLHNVQPRRYPPTLITTADTDDRVVPGHSFKFAAALQAAQRGDAPVLIRIETEAGHGAGKPINKRVEETADGFGFLVRALDMALPPEVSAFAVKNTNE
ncbi:MAG: S9 family peptidase [Deltaproteobacteria bacterium]|nr:S9 family peptidase [Deltaproteobacteria bacterium]